MPGSSDKTTRRVPEVEVRSPGEEVVDEWPIETVVLQLFNNDVVTQCERIKRGVCGGSLLAVLGSTTAPP